MSCRLTAHSDALFVTATLNTVGVLLRSRPSSANRILNAVLTFNPFRGVNGPVNARSRVTIKSMERTVRAFLINLNKRYAMLRFVFYRLRLIAF